MFLYVSPFVAWISLSSRKTKILGKKRKKKESVFYGYPTENSDI